MTVSECKLVNKMIQDFFYIEIKKGKIKTIVSGNYITNVPTAWRQGRNT